MLNHLSRSTAALARFSAHRPIHVLLATLLLATVAYLAAVDQYIPALDEAAHYYNSGAGEWRPCAPHEHPGAERLTLVPLVFAGHHAPPPLPHLVPHGAEQLLVVDLARAAAALHELGALEHDGVTWRPRSGHRVHRVVEYAKKAAARVGALARAAQPFDMVLMLAAYVAMAYTVVSVFVELRRSGSSHWLALSTIALSAFALVFALATTSRFGSRCLVLSMTEGIPFLTAIVGFKHKISIARMVMGAAALLLDARDIVASAVRSHLVSLLRDYCVVIGALLLALVFPRQMEGLRSFCLLGLVILAYDLLLAHTFYSAVLAVKVEISRARRTHALQLVLEEEGVLLMVAQLIAARLRALFPEQRFGLIWFFKLAMVGAFLLFHAFWLSSDWFYARSVPPLASVPVGARGVVVEVLATRVYLPYGTLLQAEDRLLAAWDVVLGALRDRVVLKVVFFVLLMLISANAYLLNATRFHRSATHRLMERVATQPPPAPAAQPARLGSVEACAVALREGHVRELANADVAALVVAGKLPLYALEKQLGDTARAVLVRREAIAKLANAPVLATAKLPHAHYDYERVFGACCENVIGYMPIPVGVAGPLVIDGTPYHIPMATTEGCLVALTMRGCKAINAGGGVTTILTGDGMTRGPCVSFPSLARAGACKLWLDSDEGQRSVKRAFDLTLRFARLHSVKTAIAGTLLFIRFRTTTGDAMGMNMISKGVEHLLKHMAAAGWSDMTVVAVSGNYCTDKKPAAINWIEGRGKSVVAEARIPADVVKLVLKLDVDALVQLNVSKNLVGSAMAGSVGGFNAHAANLVTAVYLACGQDPAQNVELSNCITLMNKVDGDLQISVLMPLIEVGTIGGGTILEPQGAMLELLGVRGAHQTTPGANARRLACIVASAVLAAELSLCSALAAGHLVQLHMTHNRKTEDREKEVLRLKEGAANCIKS